MWTVIRKASNAIVAEAWQELLEEEGIPVQFRWDSYRTHLDITASCEVLVPTDRIHVAQRTIEDC